MKLARFDKPPEIQQIVSSSGVTPYDPSFIESLDIGSCIDCLRKNNIWEMAIIEKFSDVRTECEICFNDGKNCKYFSETFESKLTEFSTILD